MKGYRPYNEVNDDDDNDNGRSEVAMHEEF